MAWADLVVDAGTFEPWDLDVVSTDPLGFADSRPYRERLADAASLVGLLGAEAVLTGMARLEGRPLGLVVGEFAFMAGTVGVAAGERIARAIDRSRELRLPVLAMPASGGIRMQEGPLALLQMVKAADAARRHRAGGLPYLVYLRHPTTGGVLASWASLGSITWAEPGAFLGLLGPRVVEAWGHRPLAGGVPASERFASLGLVDGVVPPGDLRAAAARVLAVVGGEPVPGPAGDPLEVTEEGTDAWASVRHSRHAARPGARELLAACGTDLTLLHGDGLGGGDDPACMAGVGRIAGVPAAFVVQDRGAPRSSAGASIRVGLRKARRTMDLAEEWRLPLLTVIDTPGPDPATALTEDGLAAEIARCIARMAGLEVPTLSLLLGEGAGGSALALLPADRVLAARHAWLAAIAPEGASAILYGDTGHAAELAVSQRIGSADLQTFGIVDRVIPEAPAAELEPDRFLARAAAALGDELRRLLARDPVERSAARARRY